jgi:hypothetical protein
MPSKKTRRPTNATTPPPPRQIFQAPPELFQQHNRLPFEQKHETASFSLRWIRNGVIRFAPKPFARDRRTLSWGPGTGYLFVRFEGRTGMYIWELLASRRGSTLYIRVCIRCPVPPRVRMCVLLPRGRSIRIYRCLELVIALRLPRLDEPFASVQAVKRY